MNSLSRYFLPALDWEEDILTLVGDEAHHCVRVLRGKVGDAVEVFDGEGRSAVGKIVEASKSAVRVEVEDVEHQPDAGCEVELCQAIPKGGNMEWIIRKSVELGVRSIQPLVTENTVARADQMDKKLQKWQRVALEACKQCGQNFLPVIHPTQKFSEWMEQRASADLELVAALDPRSEPIKKGLSEVGLEIRNARVLVGPEGDFSAEEYDAQYREGMKLMSIGDIVLKVETATLYCLSVLKYELGD